MAYELANLHYLFVDIFKVFSININLAVSLPVVKWIQLLSVTVTMVRMTMASV